MYSRRKKGQYFEIDALIALGILIVGLIYIRTLTVQEPQTVQNKQYSEESIKILRTLKVADLDPDVINELMSSSLAPYTDLNYTLAKQIGIYYFRGNTTLAMNITRLILDTLIPDDYGYNVTIRSGDNESTIYNRTVPQLIDQDIAVSKTMITGLQQTKPIIGKFARIYLSNIKNRLREYKYFGGYIGQGNISFVIKLPQYSTASEVYFEGYVGNGFNITINNRTCDHINKSHSIDTITKQYLNCAFIFRSGENNISFNFIGDDISSQYIGGGFLEVSYSSEEELAEDTKMYLPGINGIINIYDSIFFDGNVSEDSFKVNLVFNKTDESTLAFNIGDETLFRTKEPGNYNFVLDKDNFTTKNFLNNSANKNVPIRFGPPKAGTGEGQVVWITDRSNSMGECVGYGKYYDIDPISCGYFYDFSEKKANGWSVANLSFAYFSNSGGFCFNTSVNSKLKQNSISKTLDSFLANFTIELDYNFVTPSTPTHPITTIKQPLAVQLRDNSSRYIRVQINDTSGKLELYDVSGTNYFNLDNFNPVGNITIRKYDNNLEVYVSGNLTVSKVTAFSSLYHVQIYSKNVSHICYDNIRVFDENSLLFGSKTANYESFSNWGMYYAKIKPEKVPVTTNRISLGGSSCSAGDYLCYCEDKWVDFQSCDNSATNACCRGAPDPYDEVSRETFSGSCCEGVTTGLCDWENYDYATDYNSTVSNDAFGVNASCNLSMFLEWNMTRCYTMCDAWSSNYIESSVCTLGKRYNCTQDGSFTEKYCFNNIHFTDGAHTSPLCKVEEKSLNQDMDMLLTDFISKCNNSNTYPIINLPGQVPSYFYESCNSKNGIPCSNNSYTKCGVSYSNPKNVATCEGSTADYCQEFTVSGEIEYWEYDLTFQGFREWARTCDKTWVQAWWGKYRKTVPDCYRYNSEYECRNQVFDGLMPENIFTGSYANYYSSANNYSAGYYTKQFNVDKSNLKGISSTLILLAGTFPACYINNDLVIYHPYTWMSPTDITTPPAYYNISLDYLKNGLNNFSCKAVGWSGPRFQLNLIADYGSYTEIILNYTSSPIWNYSAIQTELVGWGYNYGIIGNSNGDGIFNANSEYGTLVSSCADKPPLNTNKRLSISYAIPSYSDTYRYNKLVEFVNTLNDMIDGGINRGYKNDVIPEDFWNSSDVLIVDPNQDRDTTLYQNWANTYTEKITTAVNEGKIVIVPYYLGRYFPGDASVGRREDSYGWYSYVKRENSNGGKLIYSINTISYVPDCSRSFSLCIKGNTDLNNKRLKNLAAHYFTLIYPVWNTSASSSLNCPNNEYCIPGKDPYCKVCTTSRIDLAKKLNKKYTEDLLNVEGNSISSIAYGTDTNINPQVDYFTSNFSILNSTFDNYKADGGETCTACALRKSLDLFKDSRFDAANKVPAGLETGLVSWWRMDGVSGTRLGNELVDMYYESWIADGTYCDSQGEYPICTFSTWGHGYLWQDLDIESGKTYNVTFTVYSETDPGVVLVLSGYLGGDSFGSFDTFSQEDGKYSFTVTAGSSNTRLYFDVFEFDEYDEGDAYIGVYDISVKEVFAGEVVDYIGKNNGTIVGKVQTDLGHSGEGFRFDGNGGFIDFGDPIDGSLDFETKNFSISAWFKTNGQFSTNKVILSKKPSKGYNFFIAANATHSWLQASLNSGINVVVNNLSKARVDDSKWHHYVAVWARDSSLTIYLDGKVYATGNITTAQESISNVGKLSIGKGEGNSGYFNGTIDEVLIFNRTLSPDEVLNMYQLDSRSDKKRFIVIMSDGEANYYYNEANGRSVSNVEIAKEQAINYSKKACMEYNATLFTVAFGSLEGSETLKAMANINNLSGCRGQYYEGTSEQDLDKAFSMISQQIAFNLQSINQTTYFSNNTLSSGSYIEYATSKPASDAPNGTIKFISRTDDFHLDPSLNCYKEINLQGFTKISDAKLISYSGNNWTSEVSVNFSSAPIFNITEYGYEFQALGDPFVLGIPSTVLDSKKFGISMKIAENAFGEGVDCSIYDKMIYSAYIPRSYEIYSEILERAEGCKWNITFSDGVSKTIRVPSTYQGNKTCNYTESGRMYDKEDALDAVMYNLLSVLDVDEGNNKGKVDISINENDLQIDDQTISTIPYLWGPAILEVRVWK